MKVAVFGASGPVGRVIVEALRTHPTLVPVPMRRKARPIAGDVEAREVDFADAATLAAALRGCDFAVNAVGGAPSGLAATTAALCRAARGAGIGRLVHVSSLAVYGDATGVLDETAAVAARPGAYAAAKIDSERAVGEHQAAGHEAVILRPGLVFGPSSVQWAQRMARLLRARRLGDLGQAGDGFCNLTPEADLGAAVAAALLTPLAAGRAFNLASSAPPSWNMFFEMFARALGAVPLRRIGRRRLALEGRLLAPPLHLAARLGRHLSEPIPPSLLRLFAQRLLFDPSLTDRVLAIRRTPDDAAIAATALRLRAA